MLRACFGPLRAGSYESCDPTVSRGKSMGPLFNLLDRARPHLKRTGRVLRSLSGTPLASSMPSPEFRENGILSVSSSGLCRATHNLLKRPKPAPVFQRDVSAGRAVNGAVHRG